MRIFNDPSDITNGIEETIWASIEKTVENNSLETFKVLNRFVVDVLVVSIQNKSLINYNKYVNFPASYYYISFAKSKESIVFHKFFRYAVETSARQLKEIITFFLVYKKTDIEEINESNLSLNNDFLYSTFNSFSRLLYSMISNGDKTFFSYVLNEFDNIDSLKKNSYYELKFELRNSSTNDGGIEKKQKLYKHVKLFDEYKRHVILGLRYWTIFLYNVGNNPIDITETFIKELRIQKDYSELLRDILILRNNPNYNYFEWSVWDYKERPLEKTYSPPNPNDWLTFGFVIDILKVKEIYFDTQNLDFRQLNDISFLYERIKDFIKIIDKDFDKWQSILELDSKREFEDRCKKINVFFKNLLHKSVTAKDQAIAAEELDPEKIKDFKANVAKSWEANSSLNAIFLSKKNMKENEAVENFIGFRTFFQNSKIMFVKENYQTIYNIDIFGGRAAGWIDDDFFSTVISEEAYFITKDNITNLIEECFILLKSKEISPSIILLPAAYSFKDQKFLNNPDFKRKYDFPDRREDKFFMGTYTGVEIYISQSDEITNKVIVADFEKAFEMEYQTLENGFKHLLKIEVESIQNDEAEVIYKEEPENWKFTSKQTPMDKDEALTLIKNSLNIEVGAFYEFKVKDKESFVVGIINSNIS